MDFIKSCRTNVQIAENISETACQVYDCDDGADIHITLSRLREQHILCANAGPQLWLFGPLADETPRLLSEGGLAPAPRQDQPSTLATNPLKRPADGLAVQDVLLQALKGALSYSLGMACGALRMGGWTWLFPAKDGADRRLYLHLSLHVTDAGGLYAATTIEWCDLGALDAGHVLDGGTVQIAPSGSKAELAPDGSADGVAVVDDDLWQAHVRTMLHAEGIILPDELDWVPIRPVESAIHHDVLWPAHLCLVTTPAPTAMYALGDEADRWKQWFTAEDDPKRFRNPLAAAEDWYLDAAQREEVASKQGSGADVPAVPPLTSMDVDAILETSPPFLQRVADQQAAMSGIYPTPEDNLMTGLPNSQPPSSVADPITTAPTTHPDVPGALNNEALPNSEEMAQMHGHSSSSDAPTFPVGADDLFGDMGGLDFGGGEVGDADFDFFNEGDGPGAPPPVAYEDTPGLLDEQLHASDALEQPRLPVDTGSLVDADSLEHQAPGTIIGSSPEEQRDGSPGNQQTAEPMIASPVLEKPLTPFSIKEQLLPPPIPASTTLGTEGNVSRRSSTFDPVVFREGLDFRKFTTPYGYDATVGHPSSFESMTPNISLPPKHKRPRSKREAGEREETESCSDSEEDSYESASSTSDPDLPPKLPWDKQKRKRRAFDGVLASQTFSEPTSPTEHVYAGTVVTSILECLMEDSAGRQTATPHSTQHKNSSSTDTLPTVEECFFSTGTNPDVSCIAQLASEQAVSCTPAIVQTLNMLAGTDDDSASTAAAVRKLTDHVLNSILPGFEPGEVTKLALLREPPTSRAPLSTPTSASRPTGQPRPTSQRTDSVPVGSADMFPIPTPFIRVQRGPDTWEMLASALPFWNEMSLGPVNGAKDIRAFCVLPNNEDLLLLVEGFMREVGNAYENCKLGSHVHVRDVDADDELDDYEDGMMCVQCDEGEEYGVKGAICAFRRACSALGEFLAQRISHQEPDRTIVVYMVNPFQDESAVQHLCACFWYMYKAYRDSASKAKQQMPRSDIVLQIVPIELIASSADAMVVLEAKQLAALAKEVYNRCPPTDGEALDAPSGLPNYAAPFVELASPPPKRLNFQLTGEPPTDLLHEGSALHLAYALSADRQFMSVAWVDVTGRYSSSMVYCMRGRSFAQVAEDAWDWTWDIVIAREVTWRIFIVTVGTVLQSYRDCWKKITSSRRRKQPFNVSLLSVELEPELELSPPFVVGEEGAQGTQGAGFLTPVSTPQGTSMTVSPDTSGFVAPLTPAPSDTATTVTENDPDAHVIELAEESWAVLFSPTYSSTLFAQSALATGALFKRGEANLEPSNNSGARLPCLAAGLLWTVQVRPNGNVDEGNVKQAEMTLREVLRMWRNLSVLTKARSLGWRAVGHGGDVMPVHLVVAVEGARGLDGFLKPCG